MAIWGYNSKALYYDEALLNSSQFLHKQSNPVGEFDIFSGAQGHETIETNPFTELFEHSIPGVKMHYFVFWKRHCSNRQRDVQKNTGTKQTAWWQKRETSVL